MGTVALALAWGLAWAPLALPRPVQARSYANNVLLITHPRASVLANYVALVRHHVFAVEHLKLVGIYHASETEDYRDAEDYLRREHINWITLKRISCALDANDVFSNNACRPVFERLVKESSGIIFNGGPDLPPSLYGEATLLSTVVETPRRAIFEVALSVALLGSSRAPGVHPILIGRPDFPVLGICVGMQTLNVATGGTLVQDIPSQIYGESSVEAALAKGPATWHRNHAHELDPEDGVSLGVMHPIHLTADAPAFMRMVVDPKGPEPQVLSIHHQAVDALGTGFVVYGTSDDGKIVEIMGRRDFPNVLGLQFHPERSALWDKTEEQLMCPRAAEYNFAYDTLERQPVSRLFNEAIWVWLARKIIHEAVHVNHHS